MLKTPYRPAWSVYQHKTEHWIHFGDLRDPWSKEDFIEHDPTHFRYTTTVKYIRYIAGNSSVRFVFQDLEHLGRNFIVLQREFDRILRNTTLHEGALRGVWRFEKHGPMVGTYLVKELLDEESTEEQSI